MTIVLTPYWSDGVQKLKMARQRKSSNNFDADVSITDWLHIVQPLQNLLMD